MSSLAALPVVLGFSMLTGCSSNILAVHSDFSMGLATKMRAEPRILIPYCRDASLKTLPECIEQSQWLRFSSQVQRVSMQVARASALAFPSLKERFPDLEKQGFDVFFVEGGEPGLASSGRGRIAINVGTEKLKPTDDWLAFAFALEVGRLVARHHESEAAVAIGTGLITGALSTSAELLRNAATLLSSDSLRSSVATEQDVESLRYALAILHAADIAERQILINLKAGFRKDHLGNSGWARRYGAIEAVFIHSFHPPSARTAAE